MKIQLNCLNASPSEHAQISRSISEVCSDVIVDEVDDRLKRNLDPVTMGAMAAVVSATCATIVAVLQVMSRNKDRQHPSRDEIRDATIRVEVILQQELSLTLKEQLLVDLQRLPETIRVPLGRKGDEYEVEVKFGDDLHSIKVTRRT